MVCATVPAFCRANGPPSHLGTSPSADCFVGNRPIACGNTGSGRPISLSLNTGSGRPVSLSLNTGSGRPISLSLNTGSWSPYFAFAQYGLHLRLCARAGALARIRLRPPPQPPPPRGGAQIPCRFRASRSNPQQRRALSKGSTLQSLHYYMVIS